MEQFAEAYAKYFQYLDLQKELQPLSNGVQDMLARLDELEILLSNAKAETDTIMDENAEAMVLVKGKLCTFCEQIDDMIKVVEVAQKNVDDLQRAVDAAEIELGVADTTFKGMIFKSLFERNKQSSSPSNTNLVDGEFRKPNVFNASDYFPPPPPE